MTNLIKKAASKPNTNYAKSPKINAAIDFFARRMKLDTEYNRFKVTLWTNNQNEFGLYDSHEGLEYGVKLYEANGDIFFVPGFADTDSSWAGVSLKGQDYIIDEMTSKPVIEA